MARSIYAAQVDEIQSALRPFLEGPGFKVRGRSFNRATEDGLTQVVNLQMGAALPPGATYIPGLREDLHGLFTVNLGVYVPEVARHYAGGEARSWVNEGHCCVRARLGSISEEKQDIWWPARSEKGVIADIRGRLERDGLLFLERFSSRDKILTEWRDRSEATGASSPPRIVMAIILAERGEKEHARELLAAQAWDARNPAARRLRAQAGAGTGGGRPGRPKIRRSRWSASVWTC